MNTISIDTIAGLAVGRLIPKEAKKGENWNETH